jgi:hypothetical protein
MRRRKRGCPVRSPVSPEKAAALRAEIDKYREQNPRPKSPCYEQTREQIEQYYRTAPIGEPAAVRHTQGGILRYDIETIQGRRPRVGKVEVSRFGDFYMKSAKYCLYPTGQTTLVVPTEEVINWAAEHQAWGSKPYEYEIEPRLPLFGSRRIC